MDDLHKLSIDNWDNLIELYMNVYRNSDGFTQTTSPIISGFSDLYGWPNFSFLDRLEQDIDSQFSCIDKGIDVGLLAPMILVHPNLHNHQQITEAFEIYSIRQIGQWPLMYYNLQGNFPSIPKPDDFKIVLVSTKESLADWQGVAYKVLFNDKRIPLTYIDAQKHALFVGYENDIPVASSSAFFGENNSSAHMCAILPEYRNKGYGKLIMQAALKASGEGGYKLCFSQSSKMGLKSWLSLGYQVSGYLDIFWKIGCQI